MANASPLIFGGKQAHHDVIVPLAIHESCFPLPSFYDEAAFRIGPNGTVVVCKHAYTDAMKFHLGEGMSQQEMDCLGSYSYSKDITVINGNRYGCPLILSVDTVKLYFSNQASFDFDNPSVRISCEALSPLLSSISRHWLRIRQAGSEHPNDVSIRAQGEASFRIIG